MTTGNRPTRASCAPAALVAGLLAVAVACGGSGRHPPKPEPASQLVGQALGGRSAVRSGQVELSLALFAPSVRESFTMHSATRFRLAAAGAPPNLVLTLATLSRNGSAPPRAMRVALASGPRGVTLSVQGRPVRASSQLRSALQAGYAQPAGATGSGGAAGSGRPAGSSGATGAGGATTLARLGLDASAWLTAPHYVGRAPEPSAEAAHVRAGLALAPFLADVGRLASVAAGLQQAGGRAHVSALASQLFEAAQAESGAGAVDLYADPQSRLPRSLSVSLSLHPAGAGATGHQHPPVEVSLRMSFTALGEPGGAGPS